MISLNIPDIEKKNIDEILVKQTCLYFVMKDIPHNQPEVLKKHIKYCLDLYKKTIN
jgi:hypothetical protein